MKKRVFLLVLLLTVFSLVFSMKQFDEHNFRSYYLNVLSPQEDTALLNRPIKRLQLLKNLSGKRRDLHLYRINTPALSGSVQ